MDPDEKDLVNVNLPRLLTLTTCNQIFLAYFREAGILSDVDLDSIQAAGYAGEIPKSARFYNLILTRQGSFEVLVDALRRTNQTGALKLLQTSRLNVSGPGQVSVSSKPRNFIIKIITRLIGEKNYTIVVKPENVYVHNFGIVQHGLKGTDIGSQLGILCAAYPIYFVRTIMQSRFDSYGPRLNLPKPAYLNITNFKKYYNIIMMTHANNHFVLYHGLSARFAQQFVFTFVSNQIAKHIPWIRCKENEHDSEGKNNLWNTLGNIICATFGTICSHPFHVLAITAINTIKSRALSGETILKIAAEIYKSQGICGFFTGLLPRIFGTVLYIAIFEVTYKSLLSISNRHKLAAKYPTVTKTLTYILANIVARSVTYSINSTATAASLCSLHPGAKEREIRQKYSDYDDLTRELSRLKNEKSGFLYYLFDRAERKILGKGAIATALLPFILL